MAAALPAAAASPNSSSAAQATGPISAGPLGQATYPGTSPVTVAHTNIAGLLTTGAVTATSGPTSGSSSVADISAILNFRTGLTARAATSSCRFNTNTGAVTGTAAIPNGRVTVAGVPTTPLAASPFPNATLVLPGIATIIMNRQTQAGDGTLTMTAIYVSWLGSTQTLAVGTSVCSAANLVPVPILPGKSLEIALGGLGVLLIGGLGYRATRRRGWGTLPDRADMGSGGWPGRGRSGHWSAPATGDRLGQRREALQHVGDPLAGQPSPKGPGIASRRPLSPVSLISRRPSSPTAGPGEVSESGVDGFRSLGAVPDHDERPLEDRALFLRPAGIGHDEARVPGQGEEGPVIGRRDDLESVECRE